jgi:hypothetical protein
VPQAKPRPSSGTQQLGARAKPAAKAIERILRPRLYLPDTVVWFDRGNKAEDMSSGQDPVGVNFTRRVQTTVHIVATKHTSRRTLRNIQSSFFFLTGTKC